MATFFVTTPLSARKNIRVEQIVITIWILVINMTNDTMDIHYVFSTDHIDLDLFR